MRPLLDLKNPTTYGPFSQTDYYFEHKYQIMEAMKRAKPVVKQVQKDYAKLSGREHSIVEGYKTEDADYVIMAMGSTAGTLRHVVDEMRADGEKVGSVKLRLFRPFPFEEIREMLEGKKGVAVMDRAISTGSSGPMFPEVRTALYDARDRPDITNYVYGLGGRDVKIDELKGVYRQLMTKDHEMVNYLGVRP